MSEAPQPRGKRRTATLTPLPTPALTVSQDPAAAIVDAAAQCFARWGIARTRVEDIAAEVGLARPHIYRHFASKDAIIHAVVLRQIRQHHRRLAERFPHRGPASDLIIGSLLSGIRETADDPETAFLVDAEGSNLTARSLTTSPEVLAELGMHWIPLLEYARERGELRDNLDVEKAARWLAFVQFSYLALPEMVSSPADLEAELRAFVLPALLAEPCRGSG